MNLESQLLKLGFDHPPVPKSLASYIPSRVSGNLVFTSGQLPMKSGELVTKGKFGSDLILEHAKLPAEIACINALGAILFSINDLSRITKIIRLGVFVASTPDFSDHHLVANFVSELLIEIFGPEIGPHSRFAIGVSSLPLNAPLELELTAEFL
ncbi:MAG: RidA family protein [Leptospiraceae bacterium]|nr:RidA family protein [Leptospiraceae bacterium]MCP5511762.1 RidA family protein [Leptospiraceae bacterium]